MADTELAQAGPPAEAGSAGVTADAGSARVTSDAPAPASGGAPDGTGPADAGGPGDGVGPAASGGEPAAEETSQAAAEDTAASPLDLRQAVLRGVGIGLLLLAVLVLGFAAYLYGLSGVQEARTQTVLYTTLQRELAGIQGAAAPLSPSVPAGSPLAVLDIPSIGIRDMVVVQGTSPENLTVGPGHRPDTPLPGEPGVVQIYGRRATFGGPFSRLAQLHAGDTITLITGQGRAVYTVAAMAPSTKIIQDPAPNRLLLLTASSSTIPSMYLQVDADLTSQVQPSPGVAASIAASELPMAGDKGSVGLTAVWALALAVIAAGGTFAAIRWNPWAAYLVTVPVVLAVLYCLYQSLATLLPNLY